MLLGGGGLHGARRALSASVIKSRVCSAASCRRISGMHGALLAAVDSSLTGIKLASRRGRPLMERPLPIAGLLRAARRGGWARGSC